MRRHASHQRRGFLIITVMVLMVIVVIVMSWMLTTANVRGNVAQQQINAYRDHHDLMSIRHIARSYMRRNRTNERLEEIVGDPLVARAEEPVVYEAALPDGLNVRITLARAQGTVLRGFDGADSAAQRALLESMVADLDATGDAAEYTRAIGPARIVLGDAPDRVLQSIAGESSAVFETLRSCRIEGVTNPGMIQTRLQNAGIDVDTATRIGTRLFTSQTELWRLTVFAERDGNQRQYYLYMMREGDSGGGFWEILEARVLELDDEDATP